MPKNVIVLGMPRSGTSLTASIFALKGYFVTQDEANELMPPNDDNPLGFWEAEGLVERNVEVYRAVGYAGHNNWGFEPIPTEAVARIRELAPLPGHEAFVADYLERAPWVWKDPRLCLTLSYWWPMLAGSDTAVLFLERDLDEIYRSFKRVQFYPPERESRERVQALADLMLGEARRTIEAHAIPTLTLDHRRYFDDPEGVARELGAFFEIELGPGDLNVRADLNHSTTSGRVRTLAGSAYMSLPEPLRRVIRACVPASLKRSLAPESHYLSGARREASDESRELGGESREGPDESRATGAGAPRS